MGFVFCVGNETVKKESYLYHSSNIPSAFLSRQCDPMRRHSVTSSRSEASSLTWTEEERPPVLRSASTSRRR